MNETNGTSTFACNNQWVLCIFFWAPADSALNLVFITIVANVLNSLDLLSFFQFLVVKFSLAHRDFITFEVFYSEANSTQFNGVKFLNFVIILSSFIFKWTSYEPKAVNALFFLIDGGSCMVQIVTLVVFLEKAETTSVRVRCRVNHIVWLIEIDLVIISNDLSLWLSFQTHFHNVPRLIVEKAVRVTQPWDCSEEYDWFLGRVILLGDSVDARCLVCIWGLLRRCVRMVRVHVVSVVSVRHLCL